MAEVARTESDARLDGLEACVVRRRPLFYSGRAELATDATAAEDRPAHVRAGSGVTWLEGRLAIVQDDASFVGLVDPTTWVVDSVALPTDASGVRQFDDARGNKAQKLDLEACTTAMIDGAPALVAFGSGSTRARERIAIVHAPPGGGARARVTPAPALYAALRARKDFSGSELNVEGAVLLGDVLWLVQRGNGEARGADAPVNAMIALPFADVLAALSGEISPVRLGAVTRYTLGDIDGVPLTFTDATAGPDGTFVYVAAAEASPDAVSDGPVRGSALGVISGARARYTRIVNADGAPFLEKVEGVVMDPGNPRRAFVVTDADDATRPSELCELMLDGPWW